jgi:7,8-dihydro-6-hydroxymethylpterin-pyrophosphokinase
MENNDKFLLGFIFGICMTVAAVLLVAEGVMDVKVKPGKEKGSKVKDEKWGQRTFNIDIISINP